MPKKKRDQKRSVVIIAVILLIVALIAGVIIASRETSNNTQISEQNSEQQPPVAQDISQAEAEQVCQNPNVLRQYIDIEAVDIVPADSYTPYFVDNGDGTKSLQWSGSYKNSGQKVFFACSVAHEGETVVVKRITLY